MPKPMPALPPVTMKTFLSRQRVCYADSNGRMDGTLPERSGMSVSGSNLLPVMNDMIAFGV